MSVESAAAYRVGEVVRHQLFHYRGVVVDVDPAFALTDEWYEQVARSRPPKDKPWYHVLVDDAEHTTYVAERNLASDDQPAPIRHPQLGDFFSGFKDGRYLSRQAVN